MSDALAVAAFWERVYPDPNTGCWIWGGSWNKQGYGNLWWNGKCGKAHRFSYLLHNGVLDPALDVCHSCDNPWCVNPDHLFLGTVADNMRDMLRKGRGNKPRGTRNCKAKLDEAKVRQIRKLSHSKSTLELAAIFDVERSNDPPRRDGKDVDSCLMIFLLAWQQSFRAKL